MSESNQKKKKKKKNLSNFVKYFVSIENATSIHYKLLFSLMSSSEEFTPFAFEKHDALISILYFHFPF